MPRAMTARLYPLIRCCTLLCLWLSLSVHSAAASPSPPTIRTSTTYPDASAWARQSILLPTRRDYGYGDFAIDGSSIAFFSLGPHPRGEWCSSTALRAIRLFNLFHLAQSAVTVDHLPTPPKHTCFFYNDMTLAYPWLVFSEWQTNFAASQPNMKISFIALNLVTHQRRLLATSPHLNAQGEPTGLIIGWHVSGTTVVWSEVDHRSGMTSTSIHVKSILTGRETTLIVTPWFHLDDPRAWGVRGPLLSGDHVVWTRTTAHSTNVILYNLATRKSVALTHDGVSLVEGIAGNTVAWIVSKVLQPGGIVRVYDLRSGTSVDMPGGPGFNIHVGDGLVSWIFLDNRDGAVPLYFVRRHTIRYYLPTSAQLRQHAAIPDVRIFGRVVLVPIILHADLGSMFPERKWVYRVDIF